jgi:uncharacterized protein (DUF1330 family)
MVGYRDERKLSSHTLKSLRMVYGAQIDKTAGTVKGYLVANYTIHDSNTYRQYVTGVLPLIELKGGKVLVADKAPYRLEGFPHNFIVVIEFDSVDEVKQFYDSDDYAAIKGLRVDSTNGWVLLARGFSKP